MSRRHDIDTRLEGLSDIGKIMRSMKNLSYMETRKLARFIDAQRHVVTSIETAAGDFLDHYPGLLQAMNEDRPAAASCWLLIGAERGFCGDFNEAVLHALEQQQDTDSEPVALIAVGSRLATTLEHDPRLLATVPGASTAEEVSAVLLRLIDTLDEIATQRRRLRLRVLHWEDEADTVSNVSLLPPFQETATASAHPFPPLLNLPPSEFLERLIDHYLFAALHALLYSSLIAEHQHRLRHLDAALRRLDERTRGLELRRNLLRQEEITEEIELILLNLPAARH